MTTEALRTKVLAAMDKNLRFDPNMGICGRNQAADEIMDIVRNVWHEATLEQKHHDMQLISNSTTVSIDKSK